VSIEPTPARIAPSATQSISTLPRVYAEARAEPPQPGQVRPGTWRSLKAQVAAKGTPTSPAAYAATALRTRSETVRPRW
jgi:hypothetical protein